MLFLYSCTAAHNLYSKFSYTGQIHFFQFIGSFHCVSISLIISSPLLDLEVVKDTIRASRDNFPSIIVDSKNRFKNHVQNSEALMGILDCLREEAKSVAATLNKLRESIHLESSTVPINNYL
jgi:hypothetical protein